MPSLCEYVLRPYYKGLHTLSSDNKALIKWTEKTNSCQLSFQEAPSTGLYFGILGLQFPFVSFFLNGQTHGGSDNGFCISIKNLFNK